MSSENHNTPSPKALSKNLSSVKTALPKRLSALSLSLLLLFGNLNSALAQIVVDPNAAAANRPGVVTPPNSNNVPVVNIVTPNGAGVSHNIYNQFNVGQQGLILNNSSTSVNTQLGGWIQGNPNLPYGGARVILNEINSSNPSLLNGYIEVGGQRANVIIANPAGISINGAGFINASGVTLTTGKPQLNSYGAIESYRVGSGNITISGQGLDTSTADYTRIISRAVELNSGVWANDLAIAAGTGQFDPDANPIQLTIEDASGKPLYAIDVAALGGMYAGKIRLIGTEHGVGVRNAGQIGASVGQVQINANGDLINTGKISSSGNNAAIQVATTGDIRNLGTLYTSGSANLQTTVLSNDGTLAAAGNLTLQAQNLQNNKQGNQ